MNPLTKVKLINELNQREAELGVHDKVSWHAEYKDSAWLFLGGLPYELTEGDIICVFSQYGEIVNINLVRDQKTGKSKGFCFICYEDQRSTILAVDNFNGIKIKGRTIRVDHVANYRPPKDTDDIDDVTKTLREKGCGVKTPPPSSSEASSEDETPAKKLKDKKEKHKKKKEKKKLKREKAMIVQEQQRSRERNSPHDAKIKKEKEDSGYNKYAVTIQDARTQREESKGSRDERNERSLGKDSGREQQKDDWSRDHRGDKNRYDRRTEHDQMNAEWRNERWEDRSWKDDKQNEQDRKEDRRDDRGRREDRQDNRTAREERSDEREWRENRQNDRSRGEDKEDVRDSRSGASKERNRESSRYYESHYESHSSGRDDKAFYSESYSYSRQRIEGRGRDRHDDNREQYGVSENRRH